MKIVELKKAIKQELSDNNKKLSDVISMTVSCQYYDEGSVTLAIKIPFDTLFIDLAEEADEKLAMATHNKLVKAYGSSLMKDVEIGD